MATHSSVSFNENFSIGDSIDSTLKTIVSPFSRESIKNFVDAFNDAKTEEPDASGDLNGVFNLISDQSDANTAMGVGGDLELSFGPISGDANVQFTMNNVQGSLESTIFYHVKRSGEVIKVDINAINNLELSDKTKELINSGFIKNIVDFESQFGKYLIIGKMYGGELIYKTKYSTKNKSDKKTVHGALHVAYDEVGASISGSVNGDYTADDINKSINIQSDWSVVPSVDDENKTLNIILLMLSLLNNPSKITKDTLPQSIKDALSEDTINNFTSDQFVGILDGLVAAYFEENIQKQPTKYVVIPLSSVKAVYEGVTEKTDASKHFISFNKFASELFQTLKSFDHDLKIIGNNSKEMLNDTEFIKYSACVENLLKKIQILDKPVKISETAQKYNEYITTTSPQDLLDDLANQQILKEYFYEIQITQLKKQFETDILTKYENNIDDQDNKQDIDEKDNSDYILYGSRIRLTHKLTDRLLHSHYRPYPVGSKQQQITGYKNKNLDNYWVVTPLKFEIGNKLFGKKVKHGDFIRLQHYPTMALLNSANIESHVVLGGNLEVCGYYKNDNNNTWKVELIDQDKTQGFWTKGGETRLIHNENGAALHSHPYYYPNNEEWGLGEAQEQQEITCFPSRDDNDIWIVHEIDDNTKWYTV